jgi:hypothetical protein
MDDYEVPGDKRGDEGVRVLRLESSKEGPHVTNEGPSHITWWQRVLLHT